MKKTFLAFTSRIDKDKSTKTINVYSRQANLGTIRWFSPWRRYVFFPEPGTLFDRECLNEIEMKLALEMIERKQSKIDEKRKAKENLDILSSVK